MAKKIHKWWGTEPSKRTTDDSEQLSDYIKNKLDDMGSHDDPLAEIYKEDTFNLIDPVTVKKSIESVLRSNLPALNELNNEHRNKRFKHLDSFSHVSLMTVMFYLFLEVPTFRADIRTVKNNESSERINPVSLSERAWEYRFKMSLMLRNNYATIASSEYDYDVDNLKYFNALADRNDYFRSALIESQRLAREIYDKCSPEKKVDIDSIKKIHIILEKLCVRVYYVGSKFFEVARPTEPNYITTGDNPDKAYPQPPDKRQNTLSFAFSEEENELTRAPLKLKKGAIKVVKKAAEAVGMNQTEFMRRAIFAAIENPEILDLADSAEEEYINGLGASRWHNDNE